MAKKSQPECSECGASGAGAQFSIFSPHGFGTYCVECEEKMSALLRSWKINAIHTHPAKEVK